MTLSEANQIFEQLAAGLNAGNISPGKVRNGLDALEAAIYDELDKVKEGTQQWHDWQELLNDVASLRGAANGDGPDIEEAM